MNLFGNALKYTDNGFIQIRFEATPLPAKNQSGKSHVTLVVTDSGRGMSADYLRDKLFTPFAQENTLTPGTGLGLSIVKQIVESMGGEIKVESEKGQGTKISVGLTMTHAPKTFDSLEQSVVAMTGAKTEGLKVGFLGFEADSFNGLPDACYSSPTNSRYLFMTSLHKMCKEWFGMDMHIVTGLHDEDADIYLTTQQGSDDLTGQLDEVTSDPKDKLTQKRVKATPLLVICDAASTAQRMIKARDRKPVFGITEYISQPCGPRKLAKTLSLCLERMAASTEESKTMPTPADAVQNDDKHPHFHEITERRKSQLGANKDGYSASGPVHTKSIAHAASSRVEESEVAVGDLTCASPKRPPITFRKTSTSKPAMTPSANPRTVLLVDDNHINLNLLVNYMKKNGHTYVTANNGLEALVAFKATTDDKKDIAEAEAQKPSEKMPSLHFDFILMDISMPVMDGLESTRQIRAHERQHNFSPPATIIALTGVASTSTQQDAYSSGVDLFLTKPVRLKELTRIFDEEGKLATENECHKSEGKAGSKASGGEKAEEKVYPTD